MNSDNEYFQIKKGTWAGENLYKLYQKAYTPWEWQVELKSEAEKIGIDFFSTPFDKTAVDFLEDIGVEFYKIASFEVVDIPLIRYVASKGKPIIMSTGMASLEEIKEAVEVVKGQGNENLCLLKCSSAYPAITDDMNLKTIEHLKQTFNMPIGLSDHSMGFIGALTAVALGAKVIEKHFCLSREIETPDSSFSMEPNEFKEMVKNIRLAEKAIGKVSYDLSPSEEISGKHRKSIFVVENIKKGEKFTENNIRVIRPGQGLLPKHYEDILEKHATSNIKNGIPLTWDMVSKVRSDNSTKNH
jgi:pseudaminic acid synthase